MDLNWHCLTYGGCDHTVIKIRHMGLFSSKGGLKKKKEEADARCI